MRDPQNTNKLTGRLTDTDSSKNQPKLTNTSKQAQSTYSQAGWQTHTQAKRTKTNTDKQADRHRLNKQISQGRQAGRLTDTDSSKKAGRQTQAQEKHAETNKHKQKHKAQSTYCQAGWQTHTQAKTHKNKDRQAG